MREQLVCQGSSNKKNNNTHVECDSTLLMLISAIITVHCGLLISEFQETYNSEILSYLGCLNNKQTQKNKKKHTDKAFTTVQS